MQVGRTVVAALVAVGVLAGAASAASFTDPTGDVVVVPEGADVSMLSLPDITALEVTNTPDGLITFRLTLAVQTLSPLTVLAIALDTDKDLSTGDEGLEAAIGYLVNVFGQGEPSFDRWDGAELSPVETTAATVSFTAGVLTVTVPRSELFDTRGVAFAGVAAAFTANLSGLAVDVVPDGDTLLTYDLEGLPPPPPPTLSASKPTGTPARPRAGKRFVVTSFVTRDDTETLVTSGTTTCVVRVGDARLRATGRLTGGGARCTMTVPRNAKGKTLRGTMTVRAAGATVKRTFTFRVV